MSTVSAMKQEHETGRAVAWAARINASAAEALAARACVRQLEGQVIAARLRADRLAARLARIESYARRALPRTRDEAARIALGDIAVTAGERDAPAAVR
jgi:primosomal protein N''